MQPHPNPLTFEKMKQMFAASDLEAEGGYQSARFAAAPEQFPSQWHPNPLTFEKMKRQFAESDREAERSQQTARFENTNLWTPPTPLTRERMAMMFKASDEEAELKTQNSFLKDMKHIENKISVAAGSVPQLRMPPSPVNAIPVTPARLSPPLQSVQESIISDSSSPTPATAPIALASPPVAAAAAAAAEPVLYKTHCITFQSSQWSRCNVCNVDIDGWSLGNLRLQMPNGVVYDITNDDLKTRAFVKFFIVNVPKELFHACGYDRPKEMNAELEKIKKYQKELKKQSSAPRANKFEKMTLQKLLQQSKQVNVLDSGKINAILLDRLSPIVLGYIIVDSLDAFTNLSNFY